MGAAGRSRREISVWRDGLAGEDGAQVVRGVAGQEILQRLGAAALLMEVGQEARDGAGDIGRGATIANGAGDGSNLADAAADAEVVGVHHFAVDFNFFAFEADVGDPVLAARVGAAGDVQLDVFLVAGEALVELFGEPARVRFGFGEREFAEFGAGAGDRAANEGVV